MGTDTEATNKGKQIEKNQAPTMAYVMPGTASIYIVPLVRMLLYRVSDIRPAPTLKCSKSKM